MAFVYKLWCWFKGFRPWKVSEARAKLSEGFYDSDTTIDKTIEVILNQMNYPLVSIGQGTSEVHICPNDL
jgi:hypothetical protein